MNQAYILKRPLITEKTLAATNRGEFTFEVDPRARKEEIARVIENVFSVHVVSVKTINLKGKTRRSGSKRRLINLSSTKKAMVQLEKGEKIALFETVDEEKKKGKK